jgi:CheY-like chemotaxis protein
LSATPRILYVGDAQDGDRAILEQLSRGRELVLEPNPLRAMGRLVREQFGGIYVSEHYLREASQIGRLLESQNILENMPDGVVVLDTENVIIWGNARMREWAGERDIIGANFYSVLNSPEILGPDYCPFHTALATNRSSGSTLRVAENKYLQVHAAPVMDKDGKPQNLIVSVRDVTQETLQQQKLARIHQAGVELADLSPEVLSKMPVEDRIELLKQNILHYTQDLLNFDVVEIRLLEHATGKLTSLLAEGLTEEAQDRTLYALPQGNGVTGFVAATGKSYLCEDTTQDPLYLEGCAGAKSSLTVPLILHDVIGTFNVESPEPRAFTENDRMFLEIFSRDVAVALNTLELLVAQQQTATLESVDAIHSAVAMPVDEILNDAVNLMQHYIGHETEVRERVQRILRNARDIKQVIHKVGRKMAPVRAELQGGEANKRPGLHHLRVLVVDADEAVRSAAHSLLERYGCIVESAHDGVEAVLMVRNLTPGLQYDAIIADIRLPDMSGYQFMLRLQELMEFVPLILMTGYGYDPGHSIVKARQAGLKDVLYKPFRLDMLLDAVERASIAAPPPHAEANAPTP